MHRYTLTIEHTRGHCDFRASVRRSESTIPIGLGCGRTPATAVASAIAEVRERRRAGEFHATYRGRAPALHN